MEAVVVVVVGGGGSERCDEVRAAVHTKRVVRAFRSSEALGVAPSTETVLLLHRHITGGVSLHMLTK